jgi:DNA-binding transcriptional LysR family regulator
MADGIGDIELFRAIVEAGGISAGAVAIGSSPPAVSRRLSALEGRLGVRLAERSARRFRLTDEGILYYDHCHRILVALRDAEAEVSSRGATARGLLKVGAPMELGRRRIAPLIADFAAQHPALEAHLVLSEAGLEVGQDSHDVALRVDRPDDPAVRRARLRRPGASSAPHRPIWRRMARRSGLRLLRSTNASAWRAVTACTIVGGSALPLASRRSRSAAIFPAAAATCSIAGLLKVEGSLPRLFGTCGRRPPSQPPCGVPCRLLV